MWTERGSVVVHPSNMPIAIRDSPIAIFDYLGLSDIKWMPSYFTSGYVQ